MPGPGVFIGLILFVAALAALVFLTVRWSLVVPIVVIERRGALAALGPQLAARVGILVARSRLHARVRAVIGVIAFAVIFVATLLLYGRDLVDALVGERSLPSAAVITFVNGVVGAALMPIPAIGMTLLYLDLRFRKGEQVPQPGQQSAQTVSRRQDRRPSKSSRSA